MLSDDAISSWGNPELNHPSPTRGLYPDTRGIACGHFPPDHVAGTLTTPPGRHRVRHVPHAGQDRRAPVLGERKPPVLPPGTGRLRRDRGAVAPPARPGVRPL